MTHILLKLTNGDDIIGRLAMEDKDSITIENPVIVKLVARNTNLGYTFLGPWYSFGKESYHSVDIQRQHIISSFDDVNEFVADQYEKFLDYYNNSSYNEENEEEDNDMDPDEMEALLDRFNHKGFLH